MNELFAVSGEAPDLSQVQTVDLRSMLSEAIGITAESIRRVAAIWSELERRGEDMSAYRFSLRAFMSPVAAGRLLPEAVASYAGRPRVLDLIATLKIEDQRRVISGEPLEIVSADGAAKATPLAEMTYPEITRIIKDGRIRPADEQRLVAKRLAKSPTPPKKRGRPFRISVNSFDGLITIGGVSAPVEDVIAALRAAHIL